MLPALAPLASSILLLAAGFSWPGSLAVDARDLESLDRGQRLRAVERLALRADPEVRSLLVARLVDPDATVRAAAGRALIRAGAIEGSLAAVRWTTATSPVDRPIGLDVLREAQTLSPEARRAVERSLSDNEVSVRLLALDVLARHDPTPSFAALAAAIDDEQREVRLRTIRMLERSRDPRAPFPLLPRLGDADRQVRQEAIRALGVLGDARAAPALLREAASGADDVRIPAIDALARLKAPVAVPLLSVLARRRPVDEVVRHAQLALGDIGTDAAVTVLIERLREPPVGTEVQEGLRRAGAAAVMPLLGVLSSGSTGSVRTAAALLGALGDRRATVPLAALVTHGGSATAAALTALAALRDPESLAVLVHAAADPVPEVRQLSLEALASLGDPNGSAALKRTLADGDPGVRRSALRLAARLHAVVVVADVVARVGDPDLEVAREAVATLTTFGREAPGAGAALLARLRQAGAGDSATPVLSEADLATTGDALETTAAGSDGAAFAAALPQLPARARPELLRGLIAVGAGPFADAALIETVFALLVEGGAAAAIAADALALVHLPADGQTRLLLAFDQAEPAIQERLCEALAQQGGVGWERLEAILQAGDSRRGRSSFAGPSPAREVRNPSEGSEVDRPPGLRAAAAWAVRHLPAARKTPVLQRLATDRHAAVSANARAALAAPDRVPAAERDWVAVRLVSPGGAADLPARRWLRVMPPGSLPIWMMSDDAGASRVWGAGSTLMEISAADPQLSLQSISRASGRSPAPPPREDRWR